jgi:hypothetical protein
LANGAHLDASNAKAISPTQILSKMTAIVDPSLQELAQIRKKMSQICTVINKCVE